MLLFKIFSVGLSTNVLPMSYLLRPVPRKPIETTFSHNMTVYDSINKNDISDTKPMLETTTVYSYTDILIFLCLFVSWFGIRSGDTALIIDTPIRSKEMGLSKPEAAILVSVFGAFETIMSAPFGFLGDKVRFKQTFIVSSGSILSGLSMCVSMWYTSFGAMTINSVLVGIGTGGYTCRFFCKTFANLFEFFAKFNYA